MASFQNSWLHRLFWGLTMALVASAGVTLAAQGPGSVGGRGRGAGAPGRELMAGLRNLDLTSAQRDQMRSITQNHRTEFQSLAERMRTARQGLAAATTSQNLDEAAIRSAAAQLAEVQADAAVLRARVRQELWNALTPEQQQKATALRTEREQRQQQRRERLQERLKQRRATPVP